MAVRLIGVSTLSFFAVVIVASATSGTGQHDHGERIAAAGTEDLDVKVGTGRVEGATDLAEAAALVSFNLRVPDFEQVKKDRPELRPSFEFVAASLILGSGGVPSDRNIIRLYFGTGPGPALRLAESMQPFSMGEPAAPIVIQGTDGWIQRADDVASPFTSLHWRRDGVTFLAQSILDGDWTLDDLLALLDTIQEVDPERI